MIPAPVIAILVIGVAGSLALMLWRRDTFYRLLRIEFAEYRGDWIDDGKPSSWYSPLPENDGISSQIAASWLAFSWLFFTPARVNASHPSSELLKRMRLIALAQAMLWIAVLVGIVCYAMYLPSTDDKDATLGMTRRGLNLCSPLNHWADADVAIGGFAG
jgi:hypothetical protein